MPIRGAIVGRGNWFRKVIAELQRLGFVRTESPGGILCPGFYWFGKGGYLVRIMARNTLQIAYPDGRFTEKRVPDINDVCRLLIDLDYEVQSGGLV